VLYDTLDEEKEEVPTEDVGIFQRMKNFFTGSSGTGTSDSFFSPCPPANIFTSYLVIVCMLC